MKDLISLLSETNKKISDKPKKPSIKDNIKIFRDIYSKGGNNGVN